jgi:hypothetical protein
LKNERILLLTPRKSRPLLVGLFLLVCASFLLSGCLEQYEPTRLPQGALLNFLLHLQNGELDDASAYFAPGLVTPSAQLDQSLADASDAIKKWDIRNKVATGQDLPGGERDEVISGQVRPHAFPGTPTPGAEEGWQQTDVISATIVFVGSGWRVLDYRLLCCTK